MYLNIGTAIKFLTKLIQEKSRGTIVSRNVELLTMLGNGLTELEERCAHRDKYTTKNYSICDKQHFSFAYRNEETDGMAHKPSKTSVQGSAELSKVIYNITSDRAWGRSRYVGRPVQYECYNRGK